MFLLSLLVSLKNIPLETGIVSSPSSKKSKALLPEFPA